MGQTASEPITTKQSSTEQNEQYLVGCSSMQGWRESMEDAHAAILSLPNDPGAAFFAVYDGHGGESVAAYASEHLHRCILARPEYQQNTVEALKQGFLDMDAELRTLDTEDGEVGSTAVVVLIKDKRLYCANAGDSRAVACIDGAAVALSVDHKPQMSVEAKRITEGGGWVQYNRVNGNLALSRALGDYVYKRNTYKRPEDQIVTAYPEVVERNLDDNWEFIVIACDGIWDVLSNAAVVDFCRERLAGGEPPQSICEELMNHCLSDDGCDVGADNMTVVLICLLNGKPLEDLIKRCQGGSGIFSESS